MRPSAQHRLRGAGELKRPEGGLRPSACSSGIRRRDRMAANALGRPRPRGLDRFGTCWRSVGRVARTVSIVRPGGRSASKHAELPLPPLPVVPGSSGRTGVGLRTLGLRTDPDRGPRTHAGSELRGDRWGEWTRHPRRWQPGPPRGRGDGSGRCWSPLQRPLHPGANRVLEWRARHLQRQWRLLLGRCASRMWPKTDLCWPGGFGSLHLR
jgi:hypothetical protein